MKKGKNTKSSAQWACPLIRMSAVKGLTLRYKGAPSWTPKEFWSPR